MNVMAQAHNKTREVVAEAAKFGHKLAYRPLAYRPLFIAALKDFHKAHSYTGRGYPRVIQTPIAWAMSSITL